MAQSTSTTDVWNLPELVEYFRSDAEISEGVSASDLESIHNYSSDWVKLVRAALEYQGFDPRVILSQLLRNRKAYDAQKVALVEWDLSNVGDNLKIKTDTTAANKFSNRESLVRDINFLITVFLSRNNHINKIVKKSRGGVEEILSMLKEKYDINDDLNISGTSLESRTITLPRIAGVFPGSAVKMFHDQVVKEIVSYDSFPGTIKPASHSICSPLLPSVCPHSLQNTEANNFHSVMIWVAVTLDEIIHRKDKVNTPLIDLLGYYRAGYQSAAVPEKSRVTIFTHLGLLVTGAKTTDRSKPILTAEAKALAASCFQALESKRLDDENHDLLIKVAKHGDMTLF